MATTADARAKPGPASQPPPTEPAQAKDKDKAKLDYYGYVFEANKTPTTTFDALLRAIGQHVIDHLGDTDDKVLKPSKLAAFYKAVGGDYDKLFVHAPHESISYIWQVFGCRHTLEPTDSDENAPWNFEPPTIPAVTLRGFVRWESIQVLLTPEEHVPFIIYAVRHWNLRHPDTGEPFPPDITPAAFPAEPDAEIIAWYDSCGEKLRKEATPKASPRPSVPSAQDRVHAAFSHVRAPGRADTPDYFSHHRNVPFTHVSPGHTTRHTSRGSSLRLSPDRERAERVRYSAMSPHEERARRRSFSDYPSPHGSPREPPTSAHLHPSSRPAAARRHSHPRRLSPEPDESDSDDDTSPRASRRGSVPYSSGPPHRSPKVPPRYVHVTVPANGTPAVTPPVIPTTVPPALHLRTENVAKLRADDRGSPIVPGSRAGPSPIVSGSRPGRKSGVEGAKDWAKDKISSIFPGASPSSERLPPRKIPASNSTAIGGSGPRDNLNRSRSYDVSNSDTESDYERERRRRRRARDRERRERDAAIATASYEREQQQRAARKSREDMGPPSAEWDDSGGGGGGGRSRGRKDKDKERYYPLRRPDNPRRTSSHADVDRLDRERLAAHSRYDYAAADEAPGSGPRRRGAGARGRGPLEDDRVGGPRDRTESPVIKGVGGRRYPAPPESPPP